MSRYIGWIEKLKPTLYIVPDTLENCYDTISKFDEWSDSEDTRCLPGIKMGVVQGKTWQELKECYNYMSLHADQIAISFDYTYYETTGSGYNKLQKWSSGRVEFIKRLINEGVWNHDKPHHLLGCSLAREFKHYKDIQSIVSLDTSNPIVGALHGQKYMPNIGLNTKPKTLLADLINHELTSRELDMVIYNVNQFKGIIGR